MKFAASTPKDYINQLPVERKKVIEQLRATIRKNLPSTFEEQLSYGMLGYVVPHAVYPSGYHVNPALPLPFINLASQKNYIALYHSGIYADNGLMSWFVQEYPKHTAQKLDMGKSCIRFKKIDDISYQLIGELCTKMSAESWIEIYEQHIKK
ncbi:DUF1801 domain-containing protein [Maribacter sp. MAR_2009_72]|uniref:DUF1801 domain-containing protein n=1 Tax=Maribacter sp. MAR_2009_72 TaxID=1250050 RepID=UPI00119A6A96|nr:DUF1801 domain-containing protein [Maribacter sp. MAR_2009_72]TVZ16508.1 uncharacterized protein DUF1801 [Maribacter sp. MAR_2009_72]